MDWREAERVHDDAVIGDTTIPRLFHDAVDRHRERKAQLYKGGIHDRSLTDGVVPLAPASDYTALTYDDMERVVVGLAAGFRALGVAAGDRVGIAAHTRMEWAQTDFALLGCGAAVTTVYPESSEDTIAHLLGDSGAAGVVVEGPAILDRVLAVEDALDLGFVVSIDALGDHPAADRDDVYTLAEVHALGDDADREGHVDRVDDVALDDLASLVYTSGTTGEPKGVELTHGNLRANVNQVRRRFAPRPDRDDDVPVIDETSRSVSFLPLAHVFERMAGHFLMFASGASVAYAEGPDTLREDFGLVRPTAGTSVPRVYEKMYEAIRDDATGSALRERIFGWATRVGRRYHESASPGPLLRLQHRVADRLVFRKVRAALGGELELLFSGGGSLSPELAALYHGMGLPMVEGYGLTETSPVIAVNPPEAPEIGTIGPPVTGVATRLDEDVATETAPDAAGPVGELLVRGANVTRGYRGRPDATAAAFADGPPAGGGAAGDGDDGRPSDDDPTEGLAGDEVTIAAADAGDGWFRTGDLVERRPDGYLVFHDRLKELVVLSTGKNVAPLPIEDGFATEPLVEQCMVVGDGRKFVGALLVPSVERIRGRADRRGVDLPADDAEMLADDRVRAWIQEAVDGVNEPLEAFERIKRWRLVPEEWTEANGTMTPTMKKMRRRIRERHADLIDAIYAERNGE